MTKNGSGSGDDDSNNNDDDNDDSDDDNDSDDSDDSDDDENDNKTARRRRKRRHDNSNNSNSTMRPACSAFGLVHSHAYCDAPRHSGENHRGRHRQHKHTRALRSDLCLWWAVQPTEACERTRVRTRVHVYVHGVLEYCNIAIHDVLLLDVYAQKLLGQNYCKREKTCTRTRCHGTSTRVYSYSTCSSPKQLLIPHKHLKNTHTCVRAGKGTLAVSGVIINDFF
jgi:hypothetical protein